MFHNLSRLRYDPHCVRRCIIPITIHGSFSRRLHFLPGEPTSTHAQQRHYLCHFYDNTVRCIIGGRSRIRCSLHRRSACCWTPHHLNQYGIPAASHYDFMRQHIRHWTSKRHHQVEAQQGNRHEIPLDSRSYPPKPIRHRIHPYERKHRRLHDKESAKGTS